MGEKIINPTPEKMEIYTILQYTSRPIIVVQFLVCVLNYIQLKEIY